MSYHGKYDAYSGRARVIHVLVICCMYLLVLSDKGKRAIYDSVETSFDAITSSAVDLTPENFGMLIMILLV